MHRTKNKVDLFLDSGAFSAWTQGIKIDIKEYIKFIKKNKELFTVYANLDVIGIGGKQPNLLTAEKTLENQRIMEKAGLSPLPCFHFGEPFSFLQDYVEQYDYLALGVAGNSGKKLIPWLNNCFSKYICGEDGMPKIKIHGFAVTSLEIMIRYPWYSVDSTSWALTGGMGSIYVPRRKKGEWIYNENSWKIAVSNRSPSRKEAGRHLDSLSPEALVEIVSYITAKGYKLGKSEFHKEQQDYKLQYNEKWGKKPDDKNALREVETIIRRGLTNSYELRDELNIIYFQDFEKSVPEWPWAFKLNQQGLF